MKKIYQLIVGLILTLFSLTLSTQTSFSQEISSPKTTTDISFKLAVSDMKKEQTEEQLLDNPIVTFVLEYIKINKTTIFAMGLTTIGILFLLMSLFIPRMEKRQQLQQKNNRTSASTRHNIHKKIWPIKEIIAITGLVFVLIGVVIQTFNHID